MKKLLIGLGCGALVTAAIFGDLATGANGYHAVTTLLGLAEHDPDDTMYWCPMHPHHKVKKPGTCPYCNMALEKYVPQSGEGEDELSLLLTDRQIQQAGVRTEKVKRRTLVREIRTS